MATTWFSVGLPACTSTMRMSPPVVRRMRSAPSGVTATLFVEEPVETAPTTAFISASTITYPVFVPTYTQAPSGVTATLFAEDPVDIVATT